MIYKETVDGPEGFCEYADGSDQQQHPGHKSRASLWSTSVSSINQPLDMGIGSSLDCGSGQTSTNGIVKDIEVPSGPNGSNAYYDVFATFAFK